MMTTDTASPTQDGTAFSGSAAATTAARATADGLIAGFGDRALALLLDSLVAVLVFAVIGNWAAMRWGGATSSGFNLTGVPAVVTIALTTLVCFLYYWILEGTWGATFGKAIVGLRVRRVDGTKIDLRASLIRNALRIVDGIGAYLVGWIIAAASATRQRLGDRVAGTIVVQVADTRHVRMAGGFALLAAIVGSIVAIISIRHPGVGPAVASGGPSGDVSPAVAPSGAGGGNLKLASIVWTDAAGGAPHSGPYAPGSHIFATYQVTGFAHGPQGHVSVAIRVLPIDPSGVPMMDSLSSDVDAMDASGAPINGHFDIDLPAYVPGGTYAVRLHVHDAVGGQDAVFSPTFSVNAPPVAPADKLEMRDMGLATTEGGQTLAHPTFHSGETVYFTGRAFGVDFRDATPDFHVDVLLLGPSGSTILGKTDWGQLNTSVNYRPPSFFVPIDGTVGLPGQLAPGTYVIRVGLRDLVAQTSVNADASFQVQ
jgi:uncharacterized RDD family membrane protein YckC